MTPSATHHLNKLWRFVVTTRAGRIVGRFDAIEPAEGCAIAGRERSVWQWYSFGMSEPRFIHRRSY